VKYDAGLPNQGCSVNLRFSIGIGPRKPAGYFPTAKDQGHTERFRMLMSN